MSYITFTSIGQAGDLGSQLQQYASLHAVAKYANKQIVFPESSFKSGNGTAGNWGFKFHKLVDVPVVVKPDSFFQDFIGINPDGKFGLDSNMFNLDSNKNYNVTELFHLCHYWHPKDSADILEWSWNPNHLTEAQRRYEPIKAIGKETVAIHVRRGDYLLPQHHHFCSLDNEYYGTAIEQFIQDIEKYQFVVFSNDIKWCKDNLIEGEMVTFIEPGSDYTDLILMSLCDHNVIANSSFSWWAAYKNQNPNKNVICPANYLKNYSPVAPYINKNYYPKNWIAIENNAN